MFKHAANRRYACVAAEDRQRDAIASPTRRDELQFTKLMKGFGKNSSLLTCKCCFRICMEKAVKT
jgi:hypothetical protein